MTPELCVLWCAAGRLSRSSTTTRRPRRASARAVASPTMPPPTTATSTVTRSAADADQVPRVAHEEAGHAAHMVTGRCREDAPAARALPRMLDDDGRIEAHGEARLADARAQVDV